MFLGILIVLILISLGVLNARAFVCSKHEKAKDCVDKLAPYEGYLGLAGIAFGLLGLLNAIGNIQYMGAAPLYFLIGLVGSLVSLALGVLSAATLLRQQIPNLAANVDKVVGKLQPHQTNLGLAGIGIGVLYLFLVLFA